MDVEDPNSMNQLVDMVRTLNTEDAVTTGVSNAQFLMHFTFTHLVRFVVRR